MDAHDDNLSVLVAGKVPEEYVNLLYQFGSTHSSGQQLKNAVIKNLCEGMSQGDAAEEFGVKQASISRQIRMLRNTNEKVFSVIEYFEMINTLK
jgi:hypothetical protein